MCWMNSQQRLRDAELQVRTANRSHTLYLMIQTLTPLPLILQSLLTSSTPSPLHPPSPLLFPSSLPSQSPLSSSPLPFSSFLSSSSSSPFSRHAALKHGLSSWITSAPSGRMRRWGPGKAEAAWCEVKVSFHWEEEGGDREKEARSSPRQVRRLLRAEGGVSPKVDVVQKEHDEMWTQL